MKHRHSNHPSLEDQIKVLAAHHWLETAPPPSDSYLRKSDTLETLEAMDLQLKHTWSTVIDNLTDVGYLDSYKPNRGADWMVRRERTDDIVNGEVDKAVTKECRRAIIHVQALDWPEAELAVADGGDVPPTNGKDQTLREELAQKLPFEPEGFEDYLTEGDDRARRTKLNNVVGAIEESETFDLPESFDKINLIPKANRYHRSEWVITQFYD